MIVESEEADRDAIGGEVGNDEAVLFDRLQVFLHLHMHWWHRPNAAERRRPAGVSGAERAGENHDDRVAAKVERATALHATLGNGMQVAAYDERDAAGHHRHRRHKPVVLLEPTALPVGLG